MNMGEPDKPGSCTAIDTGSPGDIEVGAWDRDSVMSACSMNDGRSLTPTDIEGAQMFYGAPHAITTTLGLKGFQSQEAYMSWSTFGFMNTDGGQWEGVSGGDMMGGAVAAASWETGRLDVMYRIFDTDPSRDGAVRHRWSFPGWNPGSEQMAAQGTQTWGSPQMFSRARTSFRCSAAFGGGVPYRQFFNGVWGFDNIGLGVSARGEFSAWRSSTRPPPPCSGGTPTTDCAGSGPDMTQPRGPLPPSCREVWTSRPAPRPSATLDQPRGASTCSRAA